MSNRHSLTSLQTVGRRVLDGLRPHRSLLLVLLFALLLRVGWFVHVRPEPVSDYLFYRIVGAGILDNHMFGFDEPTAIYLPGHPVLLAGLMLVSRSSVWLSLGMITLNTVACWQVYLLARRLSGRRDVALVAAGACAVFPTAVMYSPVLGTEHLFSVLMLAAMLTTLRLAGGSWKTGLAAGMLLGLAALTRGEAAFYGPVLLAVAWVADPTRTRTARLKLVGLMMAGTVVVVTPWLVRNAMVIQPGITLSTVGGMNFYYGHNPDHYGWTAEVPWGPGEDLEANRLGWELGLEYIRDNPASLLGSAAQGTYKLFATPIYAFIWNTQQPVPGSVDYFEPKPVRGERLFEGVLTASAAFYLSLTGASLLLRRRWSRPMRILLPGLVLANWFGHAVLLFGDPRFRYFLDLTFCVPVALVLMTLWQGGRDHQADFGTRHLAVGP